MSTKPTAAERKAKLEAKHVEHERKLAEEHAAEEALAREIEQQEEQERLEEEERQHVEEEMRHAEKERRRAEEEKGQAEEFRRLEEERRVVEFQKMEQARKAAEVVAEDVEDEEHPEDEDVTELDWEGNIEKERQRMRAEAVAKASKVVGKLRLAHAGRASRIMSRVSVRGKSYICLLILLLANLDS